MDEALREYDRALQENNFETVAVLASRIQELRGVHQPEPAPENAQTDAEASLYQALMPVEQALMDGKERAFHLSSGLTVRGQVTDSSPSLFTVLQEAYEWTVVRASVVAIERALPAEANHKR